MTDGVTSLQHQGSDLKWVLVTHQHFLIKNNEYNECIDCDYVHCQKKKLIQIRDPAAKHYQIRVFGLKCYWNKFIHDWIKHFFTYKTEKVS